MSVWILESRIAAVVPGQAAEQSPTEQLEDQQERSAQVGEALGRLCFLYGSLAYSVLYLAKAAFALQESCAAQTDC